MDQICQKKIISGQKQRSESHHWILHIRIGLDNKFQFQVTTSIYWNKFAQKGYFKLKTEKVNTTIDFSIFELDYNGSQNMWD